MKKINDIKEFNTVIKSYLEELAIEDPVLSDHIKEFSCICLDFINACDNTIFKDEKTIEDIEEGFERIRKESPAVTLELVKKYFSVTYGGLYDSQIERALIDGKISSISEVNGNIEDGCILVHEIRGLLNAPVGRETRTFLSYLSTEGLSDFDRLNYIDFLSGVYPEQDLNGLRKQLIYKKYEDAIKFNWETLLALIFKEYGEVSIENFVKRCGEKDSEDLEELIIDREFSENLREKNQSSFGIALALYLYSEVREDPRFISIVTDFNSDLCESPVVKKSRDISNFFLGIGFDIIDDDKMIELIETELEYIMSKDNVQGIKI